MKSRNQLEGRFLGLSSKGKRLRVCPAGSDFNEAFVGAHVNLIAKRYDFRVASVRAFYDIASSKAFTRQSAYEAFTHVGIE